MALLFLGLSGHTLLSAVTDPPPGVTYAAAAVVMGFIFYIGVGGFILLAFHNGMNWARLVVLIVSGLNVLGVLGLSRILALWAVNRPWVVDRMYDFAISIFFLIYLNLPETRTWFRTRTAFRRAMKTA
jgi:hypothetical protein